MKRVAEHQAESDSKVPSARGAGVRLNEGEVTVS